MAIVAKFTRTLPAPTVTISSGFVFLLSEAWFTQADQGAAGSPIDGGTNSLANGGGDMKIFSDTAATTRLPIEIVNFVTGGSPAAQVHVRTPSYTSGDTITIGKDDTQTVQPAPGAAFGGEAVWQDYEAVLHLGESPNTDVDGYIDSTGNGHHATASLLPDQATIFGLNAVKLSSASGMFLTIPDSAGFDLTNAATVSAIARRDGAGQATTGVIASKRSSFSSTGIPFELTFDGTSAISNRMIGNTLTNISSTSGTDNLIHGKVGAGTNFTHVNDVAPATNTSPNSGVFVNNSAVIRIGALPSGNERLNGAVREFKFRKTFVTENFSDLEFDNVSDPANFGTSSEWFLVSAPSLSIPVIMHSYKQRRA